MSEDVLLKLLDDLEEERDRLEAEVDFLKTIREAQRSMIRMLHERTQKYDGCLDCRNTEAALGMMQMERDEARAERDNYANAADHLAAMVQELEVQVKC